MRIAFASGKGGAGKTMVASSLAEVWNRPVAVVDADVEAPNLHLFLEPSVDTDFPVHLHVPELVPDQCVRCNACRDICRFKAIARLGKSVRIFPDMCHGCGGCFAVCPVHALLASKRELGTIMEGRALNGRAAYLAGRSRIGEAQTPPLLRELLGRMDVMLESVRATTSGTRPGPTPVDALIDSPPGVSCPAMTVGRYADLVVLVAEPTPFGFHDFQLAHRAFAQLGKPLAVIVNRVGLSENAGGDEDMRRYCSQQDLAVLTELPFLRDVAEAYAHGRLASGVSPAWRDHFVTLRDRLQDVKGAAHA